MGGGGLDGVVEFDVGNLLAADDFLLGFSGKLVPGVEIVKILLHDDVASAGESGVLVADEDGVCGRAARRIFRAVHKPEHIAFIEIAKAVNFVGYSNGVLEASHDLHGKLETEIHALGADVKDQIAGRGDGVSRSRANFAEGMQFGGTWRAEQTVPGIGTEAHDAGESAFGSTKADPAQKRRKIGAEGKNGVTIFVTGIDGDNEKNCRACERRGNGLRDGCGGCRCLHADGVARHWNILPSSEGRANCICSRAKLPSQQVFRVVGVPDGI